MNEKDWFQIWSALNALRYGRAGNMSERFEVAQPAIDVIIRELNALGWTVNSDTSQLEEYVPPPPPEEPPAEEPLVAPEGASEPAPKAMKAESKEPKEDREPKEEHEREEWRRSAPHKKK
jgi:hypothetical protein